MEIDKPVGPDLSHPDAVIRLASAIHRFRCPEISSARKVSYVRSFKSASENHPDTKATLRKADTFRESLADSLVLGNKTNAAHKQVIKCAKEYLPLIHQILLTCKVQPEVARLDERLFFEWSSGIEKSKKFIKSEALMFEMIMTIACQALGFAGAASDACIAGDFPGAGRELKVAAGIMQFLAEDQLPKWISRGTKVEDKELPVEASVGTCDAFKTLFLAVGQQMAIATVLVKPGVPNYSLLAKLCLGVAEHLETFVSTMRSKAALQKERIDANFFTLVSFQIGLQRALCLYFGARGIWEGKEKYGIAIAMLSEAISAMATRRTPTSKGLPEIDAKSPLKAISKDLTAMRSHMALVLKEWEKDNSTVYFEGVPRSVPEEYKLKKGLMMMKPDPFSLESVEPLALSLSDAAMTQISSLDADRALAEELQRQLNAE